VLAHGLSVAMKNPLGDESPLGIFRM